MKQLFRDRRKKGKPIKDFVSESLSKRNSLMDEMEIK